MQRSRQVTLKSLAEILPRGLFLLRDLCGGNVDRELAQKSHSHRSCMEISDRALVHRSCLGTSCRELAQRPCARNRNLAKRSPLESLYSELAKRSLIGFFYTDLV